jgi:hypothetical protein
LKPYGGLVLKKDKRRSNYERSWKEDSKESTCKEN